MDHQDGEDGYDKIESANVDRSYLCVEALGIDMRVERLMMAYEPSVFIFLFGVGCGIRNKR